MSMFSEKDIPITIKALCYKWFTATTNKFNKFPLKCKPYIISTWFIEDISNDNPNSLFLR